MEDEIFISSKHTNFTLNWYEKFGRKIIENNGKAGKFIWWYSYDNYKILDKIERETSLQIDFVSLSVDGCEFDEKTGVYSCPFNVNKVNSNFNPDIGMQTVAGCDYMAFDTPIFFVTCKSSDTFTGNVELNKKSKIKLSSFIYDYVKIDYIKIHYDFVNEEELSVLDIK